MSPQETPWTERDDYILGWETRNWEYGIFDNPNGPYLRERWKGEGRPIRPAVDPQTSEILRLREEIETEPARIRGAMLAAIQSKKRQVTPADRWYVSEQDLRAMLDEICPVGEE